MEKFLPSGSTSWASHGVVRVERRATGTGFSEEKRSGKNAWWRRSILLLLMTSVVLNGCTSKITIRDTLESAREKTVIGWVPLDGGAVRWISDISRSLETGILKIRLEREEVPLFRVKDAILRRETMIEPYEGPHQTDEEKRSSRDIFFTVGLFLMPIVVVALPVIGVLILTRGMPNSYYGPPTTTTAFVELPEGIAVGRSSLREWRGLGAVVVFLTTKGCLGSRLLTGEEGALTIDLVPWCRASKEEGTDPGLLLRADLTDASEFRFPISEAERDRILEVKR